MRTPSVKKGDTTVERGRGNVFADLVRGKLARFSQERLERCLVALDMNVTIHVAPKSTTAACGRLVVDIAVAV